MKKAYCVQNDGNCKTCALVNYGRDCRNNPVINEQDMKYINEEEKFWAHSFQVFLHEFDTKGLLVNADHEQQALDEAIDYAEEQGWEGLFFSQKDIEEHEKDGTLDDYCSGGNRSRYLSSMNIRIVKVD